MTLLEQTDELIRAYREAPMALLDHLTRLKAEREIVTRRLMRIDLELRHYVVAAIREGDAEAAAELARMLAHGK